MNSLSAFKYFFLFFQHIFNPPIDSLKGINMVDQEGFSVRPYAKYQAWGVKMKSNNDALVLLPNVKYQGGVSLSYKGFTLSLAAGIKTPYEQTFGSTNEKALRLNYFGKRLNASIFHETYKSFFYTKPSEIDVSWAKGQRRPINEDLKMLQAGINLYLYFSPDYSMKANMHQSQKMLRSAGSTFAGLSYLKSTYEDPFGFIPQIKSNNFDTLNLLNKIATDSYLISFGYSYTWVHHQFFVYTNLAAGSGIQKQSISQFEIKKSNPAIPAKFSFFTSGGFNGKKFILSLNVFLENHYSFLNNSNLQNFFYSFRFNVGYRFGMQ